MRIILVEDCPLIRAGIRDLCIFTHGWPEVSEAQSAEEAIALLHSVRPTLAVIDIGLPTDDGFVVAERARQIIPDVRILVLTGHLNEYTVSQCERLRVHGFVEKRAATADVLATALKRVAEGGIFFTPAYEAHKLSLLANPRAVAKRLSAREVEVMLLIARGHTDAEIATELKISKSTATSYRGKIIRQMDLAGTPKVIVHAMNAGFTPLH